MPNQLNPLAYLVIFSLLFSCSPANKETEEPNIQVQLVTTKGDVLIELSNKTPLHRDNFIKLAQEGRFDSMLFHRVIDNFVIQAGQYDSLKTAQMDSTDWEVYYATVPAEIDTSLFHQRGAVGTARTDNPERVSAALSLTIVQGGPKTDSDLERDEKRINGWLQKYYFINDPAHQVWKDSILRVEEERTDYELYMHLQDTISQMAKSYAYTPYTIPEHHREVYRTIGGNSHLDQNYTIFGQVIQGMGIVDSIVKVATNEYDKPLANVYILKARVLD